MLRSTTTLRAMMLAAAALPLPAFAQEAAAPASSEAADDVVVTGYARQNTRAIAAKRDNDRIGEFLASDEIGQQPDYNISDSFRRLPGVTTVFDEDEGRYVGIRGMNPNFTMGTLDGAVLATAERQNRQLNMEAIPTTAVSALEVIKSRTPDIEGNAIGGIVNLRTRSAFDRGIRPFVGNAFVGTSDSRAVPGKGFNRPSDDGINYRADATIATRFGVDDSWGFVLTGAYSRKRRDQERLNPTGYTLVNGVNVASGIISAGYPNTVDRYGGTAKLEWRPDPRLQMEVSGTYFQQSDNELRYQQQLTRGTVDTARTTGGSARVGTAGGFLRFNDFPLEKPLYVAQGRARWTGDDGHHAAVRGSWSRAIFLEPSNQLQFNLPTSAANAYTQTMEGGVPIAVLDNPATFTNPASYAFASYTPYRDRSVDVVREGQFDWGYRDTARDRGLGIGAGMKYRAATRDFDTQQAVWGPAAGTTLNASGFVLPERWSPLYDGGQDRPQPLIDFAAFQRYFTKNPSRFTLNAAQTALNDRRSDYIVDEKVMAAYVLLRHTGDRHSLITGVRYEDTETTIDGFRVAGSALTPLTRGSDYGTWLPSATFNYDLSDPLKLRLGYYKAIGRPSPSDLGTNETLNQTTLTLTRGNPDLRPRVAQNFDASLEYYMPGDAGLISLATFYKDIRDDIYSRTAGTVVIDGTAYQVTQPQNLAGSRVFGVEGALVVNKLRFLPGPLADFGVSLNATYLNGKSRFPGGDSFDRLTQQPAFQGNAALFYQRDWLQARVSYAHIGRQYTSISPTAPLTNRYDQPFDQVDLQTRLTFGAIQIIGEVRNATNAHRENFDGFGTRDQNFFGRQFWLGAAVKL